MRQTSSGPSLNGALLGAGQHRFFDPSAVLGVVDDSSLCQGRGVLKEKRKRQVDVQPRLFRGEGSELKSIERLLSDWKLEILVKPFSYSQFEKPYSCILCLLDVLHGGLTVQEVDQGSSSFVISFWGHLCA